MRTIAIIGSTGSIGTQTLDVVRANADIRIGALAAGNNIELLEKQSKKIIMMFNGLMTLLKDKLVIL